MPPVLLALAAAAGFFAVARVFSKALDAHADAQRRTESEGAVPPTARDPAKDLGRLEWDADAGVYRPHGPRTH